MYSNFPLQNKMEALSRGVQDNILLKINGGLGDIVCAEPAIRFGINQFKGINWTIQTANPELFSHLNVECIPDSKKLNLDGYLVIEGVQRPESLIWQFIPHMTTHSVDYWGLALFGWQQPIEYKSIILPTFEINNPLANKVIENSNEFVVIHAGRHFPSKTFPTKWWDEIIREFKNKGFKVCLIGKDIDDGCGYVKVTEPVDVDLRDRLSLTEFVQFLKQIKFLFSNDSSPIHIAASGDSFIGFVASIKHPYYITHYRNEQFGYKTKNFSNGTVGDYVNINFNNCKLIELNDLPSVLMNKLLPVPSEVANYYRELRNASL